MSTPDTVEGTLYCTVHPDRETELRCNKCGRPMCSQCAVQTPVGYRCRECVRGIQQTYYKATSRDDLITFAVAVVALAVIGYLLTSIRLPILFILILGFPAGGAVAEVIIRLTEKRRSRRMPEIAAAGAVLGGIGGIVGRWIVTINEINRLASSRAGVEARVTLDLNTLVQALFSDWMVLLAIGIIAAALFARLRMRG
ncbi:MAG: B-box zinc finger protein [Anaerolinea sp.]|nr:B-box zinc finger protein [Anaerolinea sp.]